MSQTIKSIHIENYKGITLCSELIKETGVTLITGPNGSGKTSLLQAIYSFFNKKEVLPTDPAKSGKGYALVSISTQSYSIRGIFTKQSRPAISIKDYADDAEIIEPIGLLNMLIDKNKMYFDLQHIFSLRGNAYIDYLFELFGLDIKGLNEKHDDLYKSRAEINRVVKSFKSALNVLKELGTSPEQRTICLKKMKEYEDLSKEFSAKIDKVISEKQDLLESRELPEGFTYKKGNLFYEGFPFNPQDMNPGTYMPLLISLLIDRLPYYGLKTILLENGGVLDEETIKGIDRIALENNAQVLIEKPLITKLPGAIHFEDGEVVV